MTCSIRKRGMERPIEPKPAKERRAKPEMRQDEQGHHVVSTHTPDEFDVINPEKQGLGDKQNKIDPDFSVIQAFIETVWQARCKRQVAASSGGSIGQSRHFDQDGHDQPNFRPVILHRTAKLPFEILTDQLAGVTVAQCRRDHFRPAMLSPIDLDVMSKKAFRDVQCPGFDRPRAALDGTGSNLIHDQCHVGACGPCRPWQTTTRRGLLQQHRHRSVGAGSSITQPEICPYIGNSSSFEKIGGSQHGLQNFRQ